MSIWHIKGVIEASSLTEAVKVASSLPASFDPEAIKDERILEYRVTTYEDGKKRGLGFRRDGAVVKS